MSNPDQYIELYSGSRNRELYPLPSSFNIPFASTQHNQNSLKSQDPIINGAVYYTFSFQPCSINNITPGDGLYKGVLTAYSTNSSFFIGYTNIFSSLFYKYPYVNDFFVGYIIQLDGSNDIRIIRSFDPQSGRLTLNEPWTDPSVSPANANYTIYFNFPTFTYIGIPATDNNGNFSLNTEGAYNGYYIVFESPYPAYSNEYNSNIFYRKISYYDNVNRIAYFDKPLTFDYRDINGNYPSTIPIQTVTLRKSLPLERWQTSNIYNNKIPPQNPNIGPLIGTVITLPYGASNIDNYYKGKYVYFYGRSISNNETKNIVYDGNDDLEYEIWYYSFKLVNYLDKSLFSPLYGCYYIKAYNAQTRELSIEQDINNLSCNQTINVDFPKAGDIIVPTNIEGTVYASNPFEVSPGIYRVDILDPPLFNPEFNIRITLFDYPTKPCLYTTNKTWKITWRLRKSSTADSVKIVSFGDARIAKYYTDFNIEDDFTTFSYVFKALPRLLFIFQVQYTTADPKYIEWDFLEIIEVADINITDFSNDNYNPLDYIGTMVSAEQTVCYELSLASLTLPNLSLKTGSRITFYPYVYVELQNITSPNPASNQLIYSNNPNSNRALFIAPVGLLTNPNAGTFLTLYSSMVQTIKFKPNDNLRFSVYLPDGSLFETYITDIFSPYEPDPRVQIEAVFKILRKTILT
jgi:hypothetical protein